MMNTINVDNIAIFIIIKLVILYHEICIDF
jgi:hypothetical protein